MKKYNNMADIYSFTDDERLQSDAQRGDFCSVDLDGGGGEAPAQNLSNRSRLYRIEDEEENRGCSQPSSSCYSSGLEEDEGVAGLDEEFSPLMLYENEEEKEMVYRLHDSLQAVVTNSPEDVSTVLDVMNTLSASDDPLVRSDLMQQVPRIALLCGNFPESLDHVVSQYLVPLVVKYLADSNNLVRKTAQAALLVLLEQDLITNAEVQEYVSPVLLEFTEYDAMEQIKVETIALISKMAPMIGREMSEYLFLDRYLELCGHHLFQVRKTCVANFGDFFGVVCTETTEDILLEKFGELCKDGVWGVRKMCAEVFLRVCCACRLKTRRERLAPFYASFLTDESRGVRRTGVRNMGRDLVFLINRWVRVTAFHNLGPIISTFADPSFTGFDYNGCNVVYVGSAKQKNVQSDYLSQVEVDSVRDNSVLTNDLEKGTQSLNLKDTANDTNLVCDSAAQLFSQEENDPAYNTFNFWKSPLPKIIVNSELTETSVVHVENEVSNIPTHSAYYNSTTTVCASRGSVEEKTESNTEKLMTVYDKLDEKFMKSVLIKTELQEDQGFILDLSCGFGERDGDCTENTNTQISEFSSNLEKALPTAMSYLGIPNARSFTRTRIPQPKILNSPLKIFQNVVPEDLVRHYISMTDPDQADSIDVDITSFCAYYFPAVALTLGRENWPILKDTYKILAGDLQWKVRRSLSLSIYELAVILGEDITKTDLAPVFREFMSDLDDVKIGVLKHLANFLCILPSANRTIFLSSLCEFLNVDNENNWRLRLELAVQLTDVIDLLNPYESEKYLKAILITLLKDKVNLIRRHAIYGITRLSRQMANEDCSSMLEKLNHELIVTFANHDNWIHRQSFVFICGFLVQKNAISPSSWVALFMPALLRIANDRVPNLRIAAARILAALINLEYLPCRMTSELTLIKATLSVLQDDVDRDVRYFASSQSTSCIPNLTT